MSPRSLATLAGSVALLSGCYAIPSDAAPDAGGDVAAAVCAPRAVDAGGAHDAGGGVDATVAPPVPVFSLDAGATWSSLYRDYFGPAGVASCSGDGGCHASSSAVGAQFSRYHLTCPAGDASAACYASFVSRGDGGANLIEPDASFASDPLSRLLCQPDGGGFMPLTCSYYFTPVDLQRIGAWVSSGAKDN